jgi:lipoprotein-anchoring transpeptidase ErfK/SrfK
VYEAEGRRFGLTSDFEVVPLERLQEVVPSKFSGFHFSAGETLPIAFVIARKAALYRRAGHEVAGALGYREAVPIARERSVVRGVAYRKTSDGSFIAERDVVSVTAPSRLPGFARENAKWIEVSISKQTLVAYDGERPVFATLVSTGNLGDDAERATPLGMFRIHTKHVTATMSSDESGDEYDHRDVPYVQYFRDGYALHAAYWHDAFGRPKSHGCINLSPVDARWLFHWTDPPVPQAWHGAISRRGTRLHIRP